MNAGGAAVGDWDFADTAGGPTTLIAEVAASYLSTGSPIAGLPSGVPECVFQTARTGAATISLSRLDTSKLYEVRLLFAEIDQSVAVGDRKFDVEVGYITREADYDILSQAGAHNSVSELTLAAVAEPNGSLVVRLIPKLGDPLLSGISIRELA